VARQKLFPRRFSLPLRRRLNAILLQNVRYCASTDSMAEIQKCSQDAPVPPIPILPRHLHYERFDFSRRPLPSWSASRAPVIFLGDELPVPSQQCLGRDDGGDRCEHLPTEAFCLAGQPAPLIVIQPQPSAAELFSKDPIFFAQIIDGILLLLIHPAGHGDEHKPEWVKAFRSRVQSLL
jgi:hypothetical protein